MTGLVDVHAHFLTDGYVAAARAAGFAGPDGLPAWTTWSAGAHLALMDEVGIARSLLSMSSPGVHFGHDDAATALGREVNDAAASVVAAHPDRFGFLATLPLPDVGGSVREVERSMDELGAEGVILLTNARGLYLGDPRLEPVLDALDERGAVVLVHPTAAPQTPEPPFRLPPPVLEFLFETTRAVTSLLASATLERHPRVRVVVPHGGAVLPLVAPRAELFRHRLSPAAAAELPGLPIGPALRALWYDTAGTPFPTQLAALGDIAPVDRVVYGSDHCWTPPDDVRRQVAALAEARAPGSGQSWWELTVANTDALLGGQGR